MPLADVIMPEINGIELAKRIKQHRSETKVLFMSGYTGSKIFHDHILEKSAAFITKPFTRDDLSRKIRQVLDETEGNTEAAE